MKKKTAFDENQKKHPPAPGYRKLTLDQLKELDRVIFELSQVTKRTGRSARIILTIHRGNPRQIEKSEAWNFEP